MSVYEMLAYIQNYKLNFCLNWVTGIDIEDITIDVKALPSQEISVSIMNKRYVIGHSELFKDEILSTVGFSFDECIEDIYFQIMMKNKNISAPEYLC